MSWRQIQLNVALWRWIRQPYKGESAHRSKAGKQRIRNRYIDVNWCGLNRTNTAVPTMICPNVVHPPRVQITIATTFVCMLPAKKDVYEVLTKTDERYGVVVEQAAVCSSRRQIKWSNMIFNPLTAVGSTIYSLSFSEPAVTLERGITCGKIRVQRRNMYPVNGKVH